MAKDEEWAIAGLAVSTIAYILVGSRPLTRPPIIAEHKSALLFEIAEIVVLSALIIRTLSQKKMVPAMVFILALLEHFRQVIWCQRQAARSPRNVLTLLNYCIVGVFSLSRGWWDIVSVMIVAIAIHITVIVTNRPFSGLVCAFRNEHL
jgi:hypothetical protein